LYQFKEVTTFVVPLAGLAAALGSFLSARKELKKTAIERAAEERAIERAADEPAIAIESSNPKGSGSGSREPQPNGLVPPQKHSENRQYSLLREYHSQGLAQSRTSFWFSLIFAALGFAVILMGLLNLQADRDFSKQSASFMSIIAGTVIDAVSALFFVQSNKARQLMSDFFDKLRTDRKLEEALRLVEQIEDAALQARMKSLLTINFAEIPVSEAMTAALLGLPNTSHGTLSQSVPAAKKSEKKASGQASIKAMPNPLQTNTSRSVPQGGDDQKRVGDRA